MSIQRLAKCSLKLNDAPTDSYVFTINQFLTQITTAMGNARVTATIIIIIIINNLPENVLLLSTSLKHQD